MQLAADGAMMGCSRFGPATLKRPTGLCFDANGEPGCQVGIGIVRLRSCFSVPSEDTFNAPSMVCCTSSQAYTCLLKDATARAMPGNLWVSSMEKQLVCLAGPQSATPGIVLEQVSTVSACQDGLPWDVHCVGELLVTPLHSGKKHPCCVASFIKRKGTDGDLTWQQAHILQHKLFSEPNTLCLQR